MILSLVVIFGFAAVFCAMIHLIAVYSLPILAGLAIYSLGVQVDAPMPAIAIGAIIAGMATLVAARAEMAAQGLWVRCATMVAIALPAGYAGYCATIQLAQLTGMATQWRLTIGCIAGLIVAVVAIDKVRRPGQRAWVDERAPAPRWLP